MIIETKVFLDAVKQAADSALSAAKKALGIASPSEVWRGNEKSEPDYKQGVIDGFDAGMRAGRELLANEIADEIIAGMEIAAGPEETAMSAMTVIGKIIQKLADELREAQ